MAEKIKSRWRSLPSWAKLALIIVLAGMLSLSAILPNLPPPVPQPETPPTGTASLLPSSSDNPAYYGISSSAKTDPSFATTEFTDWDYGAVQSDNGKYANDTESASNGGYASVAHRFTFNVSSYDVQNFTIHWNGYYSFSGTGALNRKDIMIKNQTSGAWIDIGDMSTSDSDFTYSISQEDTADFISSSGLIEFGVLLVGRAQTGFPPKSITIKVYSDMAELQISTGTPPAYSALQAGWNNFTAWTVDVGHTLAQVNMSLALDNVNWTVISLEYSNGTRAVLVWEQDTNEYIGQEGAVVESSCTFYIHCMEAGEWYHNYP